MERSCCTQPPERSATAVVEISRRQRGVGWTPPRLTAPAQQRENILLLFRPPFRCNASISGNRAAAQDHSQARPRPSVRSGRCKRGGQDHPAEAYRGGGCPGLAPSPAELPGAARRDGELHFSGCVVQQRRYLLAIRQPRFCRVCRSL